MSSQGALPEASESRSALSLTLRCDRQPGLIDRFTFHIAGTIDLWHIYVHRQPQARGKVPANLAAVAEH